MRKPPVWVICEKSENHTAIIRGAIEGYGWPTHALTPDDIQTTLVGLSPERVVVEANTITDRTTVLTLVEQLRAIGTVRHLVVMSNDRFFSTQTTAYGFQWIKLTPESKWFQRLADMLGL